MGAAVFPAVVHGAGTITQAKVAPRNLKRNTIYQHICQFFTGIGINLLYSGAGNAHMLPALLLRKPLFIDKADYLVLVYLQNDTRLLTLQISGNKANGLGELTYLSILSWSRQTVTS